MSLLWLQPQAFLDWEPSVPVGHAHQWAPKLVVFMLAQHFAELGCELGLWFQVYGGSILCEGGVVVDTIPKLRVEADVIVVHGGRGPLDVGDCCCGVVVVVF